MFKRISTWLAASILLTQPTIAQEMDAAYNYPARNEPSNPLNFYLDASFIYWQPIQENMELVLADNNNVNPINGSIVNMDFDYTPGFKVGAAYYFNHDNWDAHAEYTWFHSNQSKRATSPPGGIFLSMWQHPLAEGNSTLVQEKWKLSMDFIDLDLGRNYYVGTKLTVHPYFGIRAAWIRQKVSTIAHLNGELSGTIAEQSHSWGLGATTGFNANCSLGKGFRLIGSAETDLLFTDYTKLSFRSTIPLLPSYGINIKQKQIYAVKPHIDLELGLGWGTYSTCRKWYLDFAASYSFQVFFDQNMFRHFFDNHMIGNSRVPNGNLYIQGLTLTCKLEF